jgi:hypothetical protein
MPARKNPSPREKALHAQGHNNDNAQMKALLEKSPDATRVNFGICRTQILEKYWELANLEPEVTKGNITGQLKALDSLCQEVDVIPPEKGRPEDKRNSERKIYRSSWMRSTKTSGSTDDEADRRMTNE